MRRLRKVGGGSGESGALVIDGRRARTAAGADWFGIGASAFSTFQHWIVDEPRARQMLSWATGHGLAWLRSFAMYNGGIGRFIPAEYPNYFTKLREFVDACGDHGLRVEIVTYADCQNPPLTFDPAFWDRVTETLAGAWNVLPSGGNEQPFNGFDPLRLHKPAGLLVGRCSTGTDAAVYEPTWDFGIYETARDDQFERKYKGVYDEYQRAITVPILIDEMIGIGEADESGRTTANAFKCWQLTAGAKIVGAMGICAHIRAGITGDPIGPNADTCVAAMVEAGALPIGQHAFGRYVRGQAPNESPDPNLPIVHADIEPAPDLGYPGSPAGSLRTHAFIDGGEANAIAPGPGPSYVGIAANGWRIEQAFAYRDCPANVFICRR